MYLERRSSSFDCPETNSAGEQLSHVEDSDTGLSLNCRYGDEMDSCLYTNGVLTDGPGNCPEAAAPASSPGGNTTPAQAVTQTQTQTQTFFQTTVTFSSTSSSKSSSPSASSSRSTPPLTQASSSSASLSPGTAAGIAIGAISVVVFVVLLAFCVIRNRRRRQRSGSRSGATPSSTGILTPFRVPLQSGQAGSASESRAARKALEHTQGRHRHGDSEQSAESENDVLRERVRILEQELHYRREDGEMGPPMYTSTAARSLSGVPS